MYYVVCTASADQSTHTILLHRNSYSYSLPRVRYTQYSNRNTEYTPATGWKPWQLGSQRFRICCLLLGGDVLSECIRCLWVIDVDDTWKKEFEHLIGFYFHVQSTAGYNLDLTKYVLHTICIGLHYAENILKALIHSRTVVNNRIQSWYTMGSHT